MDLPAQPVQQSHPMANMGAPHPRFNFSRNKVIVSLVVLMMLIGGLTIGYVLTQRVQRSSSKAYGIVGGNQCSPAGQQGICSCFTVSDNKCVYQKDANGNCIGPTYIPGTEWFCGSETSVPGSFSYGCLSGYYSDNTCSSTNGSSSTGNGVTCNLDRSWCGGGPTSIPTAVPTVIPTLVPTVIPTTVPTLIPTIPPKVTVTPVPSVVPTAVPTIRPTAVPTVVPTAIPTPASCNTGCSTTANCSTGLTCIGGKCLNSQCSSQTNCICIVPSATPSPSPIPTGLPNPTPGNPNSCNGTCGSNANCQANYVCYQGFCRNPSCTGSDSCACPPSSNPTPTPNLPVTGSITQTVGLGIGGLVLLGISGLLLLL